MASKKSRKGRKAYLNDFQPNLAGEYTYNGAHYRYADSRMPYSAARGKTLLFSLLTLAGLIIAGCVSEGGMGNTFYVIIPYMAEALCVFLTLMAVFKMLRGGERLREYIYTSSVKRIPPSTLCAAVFAALGIICSLIYIILNGIGSPLELAILYIGKILGIIASLALRKHVLGLIWEKE